MKMNTKFYIINILFNNEQLIYKRKENYWRCKSYVCLNKNGGMMRKSKCASCGISKTKFVKIEGEAIDIHKAMLPLVPKKGLTLSGYKYCGPGNPLNLGKPTNEFDEICMKRDNCYSNVVPKSECDKEMLKDLRKKQE